MRKAAGGTPGINPDTTVLPDPSWLSNKLAGQLFLHDEARLYGWTITKVDVLDSAERVTQQILNLRM